MESHCVRLLCSGGKEGGRERERRGGKEEGSFNAKKDTKNSSFQQVNTVIQVKLAKTCMCNYKKRNKFKVSHVNVSVSQYY